MNADGGPVKHPLPEDDDIRQKPTHTKGEAFREERKGVWEVDDAEEEIVVGDAASGVAPDRHTESASRDTTSKKAEAHRKKGPHLTIDVSEPTGQPGTTIHQPSSKAGRAHPAARVSDLKSEPDSESEPLVPASMSPSPARRAAVKAGRGAKGEGGKADLSLRWSWDRQKTDPACLLLEGASSLWDDLGIDHFGLVEEIEHYLTTEDAATHHKRGTPPPSLKSNSHSSLARGVSIFKD